MADYLWLLNFLMNFQILAARMNLSNRSVCDLMSVQILAAPSYSVTTPKLAMEKPSTLLVLPMKRAHTIYIEFKAQNMLEIELIETSKNKKGNLQSKSEPPHIESEL